MQHTVSNQSTLSAFTIQQKHEKNTKYPLLLANSLMNCKTQVQESRSMRMLGDWAIAYQTMPDIVKKKYASSLTQIMKVIIGKYLDKAPIQYCIGRFLLCFYMKWKELAILITEHLKQSSEYTLKVLWYTCHNLIDQIDQRQIDFARYLTGNYQQALRAYQPSCHSDFHKLMDVIFFINLRENQSAFTQHSDQWSDKIQKIAKQFKKAKVVNEDMRLQTTMDILRNWKVLLSGKKSSEFWKKHLRKFLLFLQGRLDDISDNQQNRQFLRIFLNLMEMPEVQQILQADSQHYLSGLLQKMRCNPDKEGHLFNQQSYKILNEKLYDVLIGKIKKQGEKSAAEKRFQDLLEKFCNHYFAIVIEQSNYVFLDCICEQPIQLDIKIATNILRVISNKHISKKIQARALLIISKVLSASAASLQWTQQMLSQCLNSFLAILGQKMADPLVGDLRIAFAKLSLQLAVQCKWQEESKTMSIFKMCQEFQKSNSKDTSATVIDILAILVKKFNFAKNNMHKLQPLLKDIHRKVIFQNKQIKSFVSLILSIYQVNSQWYSQALHYIQTATSKNQSLLAPLYFFQTQIIVNGSSMFGTKQKDVLFMILQDAAKVPIGTPNPKLSIFQVFFLKQPHQENLKTLKELDSKLLKLLMFFFEQRNFVALSDVASQILPAAGGFPYLAQLDSYRFVRQKSFQILGRSFQKKTSLGVCNIFSKIILRSLQPIKTIRILRQDQFLQYLYWGLNDFCSKQKKYTLQFISTLLVFKLFEVDSQALPDPIKMRQFTTLFKNVGWWQQSGYELQIQPLELQETWILPEFKVYQQDCSINFYKNYFSEYFTKKNIKLKELQQIQHVQDDF